MNVGTKKLHIKNFKSIKDLELDASRINIFIGKPNSGKSNILEAISLLSPHDHADQAEVLSWIRKEHLHNLFYFNEISNPISLELDDQFAIIGLTNTMIEGQINNILYLTTPSHKLFESSKLLFAKGLMTLDQLNEISSIVTVLSGWNTSILCNVNQFNVTNGKWQTAKGSGTWPYSNVRYYEYSLKMGEQHVNSYSLHSDGSNLYDVVSTNGYLKEWIKHFFEPFNLELLLDGISKKMEIQMKQNGVSHKIPWISTPDTLRRMAYHLAAIKSNSKSILLFEEPESHSFPLFVNELAETILEDKNNQYFITTHSSYLLERLVTNSVNQPNELAIFQTFYEDDQTKVRKLSEKDIDLFYSTGQMVDMLFNMDWIGHEGK